MKKFTCGYCGVERLMHTDRTILACPECLTSNVFMDCANMQNELTPDEFQKVYDSPFPRCGDLDGVAPLDENQLDRCPKCGGSMGTGKALKQTLTGIPDFVNDPFPVTLSPGGPGKLIDCRKCGACGWSVTTDKEAEE